MYVCGGWCEDEANGNRFLVGTIDEYDIRNDRWTVVTEIPTVSIIVIIMWAHFDIIYFYSQPRYHAGITLIQNKLQIIGGFHSDATFDRTTGIYLSFISP